MIVHLFQMFSKKKINRTLLVAHFASSCNGFRETSLENRPDCQPMQMQSSSFG